MIFSSLLNHIEHSPNSAVFFTPSVYPDAQTYFFRKPVVILTANNLTELNDLFSNAETYISKGFTGYIYAAYEAASLFEPALSDIYAESSLPLIKLCLFDSINTDIFPSSSLDFSGIDTLINNSGNEVTDFSLNTSKEEYLSAISKIKECILNGDTYQVNFTVSSRFHYDSSASSLFSRLLFMQSAGYACLINDNDNFIISLSPELFIERSTNTVICRPMKGTAKRGVEPVSDSIIADNLKSDTKNRSENIMIVDMIRNDLSRLPGVKSVLCKSLFDIETYETLHQMTSAIVAELNYPPSLSQLFSALFPCASITGAPKISTMKIIHELEKEPRGIYTGAIGIVSKDKDIFNVPIRTIIFNPQNHMAQMGIGSGIVSDSIADDEYSETLLKGSFLTKPEIYFELLETMLVENNSVFLLDLHIERLRKSAGYFLFKFDELLIRKAISDCLSENIIQPAAYSLRLILNKWGVCKCTLNELGNISKNYRIAVSEIKTKADNRFIYFKTTKRELYDREYKNYLQKGFDEVIFFNDRRELTEGSRTNIFLKKNNVWYTPEINCGLLNGVYRQYYLSQNPDCIETVLYYDDLLNADEILLTNSVRKEKKAYLII